MLPLSNFMRAEVPYHKTPLCFCTKIISHLSRISLDYVEREITSEVAFHKTGDLLDIKLFEKISVKFGICVELLTGDMIFKKNFDPRTSLILLQKPTGIIFPDHFMKLPKISWIMVDHFLSGGEIRLELTPGNMVDVRTSDLMPFFNPSFPYFGITFKNIEMPKKIV